MPKTKEPSLELMRHLLGSIDLSDVEEDKEMTEAERKDYCANIAAVWPTLEKDIKKFLYAQLMFVSNNAGNWEQVLFGRGTFNGLDILQEHWKKAFAEHLENSRGQEDFDENNPVPEI